MNAINENKVRCVKCNSIIISIVEDIFKSCVCGYIKIAGGKKDMIRVRADGSPAVMVEDYTELSTYTFID
jgi:hypothetical protein